MPFRVSLKVSPGCHVGFHVGFLIRSSYQDFFKFLWVLFHPGCLQTGESNGNRKETTERQ